MAASRRGGVRRSGARKPGDEKPSAGGEAGARKAGAGAAPRGSGGSASKAAPRKSAGSASKAAPRKARGAEKPAGTARSAKAGATRKPAAKKASTRAVAQKTSARPPATRKPSTRKASPRKSPTRRAPPAEAPVPESQPRDPTETTSQLTDVAGGEDLDSVSEEELAAAVAEAERAAAEADEAGPDVGEDLALISAEDTAAAQAATPVSLPPVAARPMRSLSEAALRLGIERLHPEQEQVIGHALSGRDALMILPTGFGKSACYQIPSMMLEKPVVVISPLRALLRDQEQRLIHNGIPCVRLDGTVRGGARKAALARIAVGGPLLVMTTPETIDSSDTREALAKSGTSLVAVDEAHCLSEWGHDFRPAYLRLGAKLDALGSPPLLALTATATPRVREAIVRTLRMRDPRVVASSPHRDNLAFEVLRAEGGVRARVLLRLAKKLRRPGIIYCATRREVDMVYALLRRFGMPAHRYHGGMTASERNTEQSKYMRRGHRSVMVATNAFGLGIDKPDIRYILHYQSPSSLEQYVQEAGRGGRDGRKANCILLYDPADRAIHEALLARSRVRPEQLFKLGKALAAWSDERRHPSLEALALSAELGPRVAAALLAKIEEAGLVEWDEDEIRVTEPQSEIERDASSLAGQFETLRTQDGRRLDAIAGYAASDVCRAVFLQGYFGEEAEAACGLCDICRGRPERPPGFFAPLAPPPEPKRGGRKRRPRRGEGRGEGGGRRKSRRRRGGRRRRRGRGAPPE